MVYRLDVFIQLSLLRFDASGFQWNELKWIRMLDFGSFMIDVDKNLTVAGNDRKTWCFDHGIIWQSCFVHIGNSFLCFLIVQLVLSQDDQKMDPNKAFECCYVNLIYLCLLDKSIFSPLMIVYMAVYINWNSHNSLNSVNFMPKPNFYNFKIVIYEWFLIKQLCFQFLDAVQFQFVRCWEWYSAVLASI